PDLPDDEYGSALGDVASGGQIMNERAVELGQAIDVELLGGSVGAEARAAHAEGELLLLAPGDHCQAFPPMCIAHRSSGIPDCSPNHRRGVQIGVRRTSIASLCHPLIASRSLPASITVGVDIHRHDAWCG